jgi:hypothetical protein
MFGDVVMSAIVAISKTTGAPGGPVVAWVVIAIGGVIVVTVLIMRYGKK